MGQLSEKELSLLGDLLADEQLLTKKFKMLASQTQDAEIKQMLDENMERLIFPPFSVGKKYLRENLGTLYRNFLPEERVLPLLYDT